MVFDNIFESSVFLDVVLFHSGVAHIVVENAQEELELGHFTCAITEDR